MEELPHEVLVKVLRFLEVKELCALALVCSCMKEVAEDNLIWKNLCLHERAQACDPGLQQRWDSALKHQNISYKLIFSVVASIPPPQYNVILYHDPTFTAHQAMEMVMKVTGSSSITAMMNVLRIGNPLVSNGTWKGPIYTGPWKTCQDMLDKIAAEGFKADCEQVPDADTDPILTQSQDPKPPPRNCLLS